MSEDKASDFQFGIALGEVKHGLEQQGAELRQVSAQVAGMAGVLATIATKMVEYDAYRETVALRHRAPSFTTEGVELAMERANVVQSAANSESIKVAALEANKPVIAETIRQTEAVEAQTHVVASGLEKQTGDVKASLEKQTRWLAFFTTIGWVLYAIVQGAIQAAHH